MQNAENASASFLPSAFCILLAACVATPPPTPAPPAPPPPPQLTANGTATRVVLASFDGLGADELQRFGAPSFDEMVIVLVSDRERALDRGAGRTAREVTTFMKPLNILLQSVQVEISVVLLLKFVPDRVVRFTTPPLNRPNSAGGLLLSILNS